MKISLDSGFRIPLHGATNEMYLESSPNPSLEEIAQKLEEVRRRSAARKK